MNPGPMMVEVKPEELMEICHGKLRLVPRLLQVDEKGDGRLRPVKPGDRVRLWSHGKYGQYSFAYDKSFKVVRAFAEFSAITDRAIRAETLLRKLPDRKI